MFWGVAVFVVFVLGLSKSGLIGSVGPMGVPLLTLFISPRDAAGILLPILILMDVFAIWAYRRDFDLGNLKILIPGAAMGIGLGWATSSLVSDEMVMLLLGVITTLFVADTYLPLRQKLAGNAPSRPWGVFWGAISGLTSFVSHSGSPPYQVHMLPQRLAPVVYAGTTAWFFATVNLIKLPPYFFLGQLSVTNLTTSLMLAPVAIAGVLLGIFLVRRISLDLFYRVAYALVFFLGLYLIYRGVTGLWG